MNKEIKYYTREELKGIIYSDSKKLKKMYPSYRWGQAVFNYIDQYIGVARKVQFEDHVDCFYNDDAVDAFVEKALDRIYDSEYQTGQEKCLIEKRSQIRNTEIQ